MKHLIAVALLSVSTLANAGTFDICPDSGKSAYLIMKARQRGVDMSRMMEIASSSGIAELDALNKSLTIDAYKVPRYSTPENQQKAAEDFRDRLLLECYTRK